MTGHLETTSRVRERVAPDVLAAIRARVPARATLSLSRGPVMWNATLTRGTDVLSAKDVDLTRAVDAVLG